MSDYWKPSPVILEPYVPPGIVLATVSTNISATHSGTVEVAAPLVDPRVRTKFVVFFSPTSALASTRRMRFGTLNTIWTAIRERDRTGPAGIMLPVQDIDGTAVAPVAAPPDSDAADTGGFGACAWEGGSVGDEIYAQLHIDNNDANAYTSGGVAVAGLWIAQSGYAPLVPMWPEEWDRLKTRMASPQIVGGVLQLSLDRAA